MEHLIVRDQDPVYLNWAQDQLGVGWEPSKVRTLSHVRINDDTSVLLLAVVVFSNFSPHACELSIASTPGLWATRRYVRAVYESVFTDFGRERFIGLVEHTNAESIEMHKRLGHKFECELEDWFGRDKPGLVFGLTKRDYLKSKWAPKNEGAIAL
jgi:hypothetical protein